MSLFDGRHRWGPVIYKGARYSRTCRVCGRTDTAEALLPASFMEDLIEQLERPNVYRTLLVARL